MVIIQLNFRGKSKRFLLLSKNVLSKYFNVIIMAGNIYCLIRMISSKESWMKADGLYRTNGNMATIQSLRF